MSSALKKRPPVVMATEGLRIVGMTMAAEVYPQKGKVGEPARIRPINTRGIRKRAAYPKVTFSDSTGIIRASGSKKDRVIQILATMPQSLTQWDCSLVQAFAAHRPCLRLRCAAARSVDRSMSESGKLSRAGIIPLGGLDAPDDGARRFLSAAPKIGFALIN